MLRLATLAAVLCLMLALSPPAAAQADFTVTVETKTNEHPYFGQGDPHGYTVNGVQGLELTLERGNTYVFQMSNVPADHPFYISTDPVGAGAGLWTVGVTGNFATGNATLTFTVPADAPDELWYQCAAHLYMGWRINVVDGESDEFAATLSGAQEVPGNASRASGAVTATLAGNTLSLSGSFEGLTGPYTASHLHFGYAGQNGPVAIGLAAEVAGDGLAGTYAAADNTFDLTAAQLDALLGGRLYVNVHSTVYPPGEIRGQVLPAGAPTYHAVLTGRAEIPANRSQGVGGLVAQLDGSTLVVTGAFSGLGSDYHVDIGSHIHIGPLHENGPIVFDLTPTLADGLRAGTYSAADNTFQLSAQQIEQLNDEQWYVNVHSQEFPPGEIRGQLFTIGTRTFEVHLIGDHEAPPVDSDAFGGAIAVLQDNTLRLGGAFQGLGSDYTASHIHVGATGAPGPVVFNLSTTVGEDDRSGTWALADNAFTLSGQQLDELFAAEYFINVHSVNHPPGEIRGQLVAATNLPPAAPLVTSPAAGTNVIVEGEPWQTLTVEFEGSDPNVNPLAFAWQLATDQAFDDIIFTTDASVGSSTTVTFEVLNALLAGQGVEVGQSLAVYQRAVASDGGFLTEGDATAITLTRLLVDVEPGAETRAFSVAGPAPNPFGETTALVVDLPQAAEVTLRIYDLLGRLIVEDRLGLLGAGQDTVIQIDGAGLAAGVYVYRLEASSTSGTHAATGRMVRVP